MSQSLITRLLRRSPSISRSRVRCYGHHRNNNSLCSGGRKLGTTRTTTAAASISLSSSLLSSYSDNTNFNNNNLLYHRNSKNGRTKQNRFFSSAEEEEEPRESMPFDVLIVGGGPAGLAASIRLKQLCLKHDKDLSVCVIDKGSEIGAHILSGNVFDPKAMNELFPEHSGSSSDDDDHWTQLFKEEQGSCATLVRDDEFHILYNDQKSFKIPNFLLPPQLHNDGNYIISLSQLCRWLAQKAEALGVEIYPGFAADQIKFSDDDDDDTNNNNNVVRGIITKDVGLDKNGEPKSTFERGMELVARQTLFAEGARGSCSEFLIQHYNLRDSGDSSKNTIFPQTYGLGIKEVWQVNDAANHPHFKPGLVQHTLGYPLQSSFNEKTFGGSFLYCLEPDLILIGMVIGLDYSNPYLNPYREFQRWKTHPQISKFFCDNDSGDLLASPISYGARVLNEGGYHSIPNLTFPGGALIGCSAGFLNAVKIKGTHTAMKSGMLAAEATFEKLTSSEGDDATIIESVESTGELPANEPPIEITNYSESIQSSWIYKELYEVRNCHEAFSKFGTGLGLVYTAFSTFISKGKEPWTLSKSEDDKDSAKTEPEDRYQKIEYPQPDNKLTFDLLTNLQRSNTYHDDDQPSHLRIKQELENVPKEISIQTFAGPEQRFCPASVYEYVDNDDANNDKKQKKKLVVNAQNCVHCKCCSIKMPKEYINWTVPEGGGGPQYQVM